VVLKELGAMGEYDGLHLFMAMYIRGRLLRETDQIFLVKGETMDTRHVITPASLVPMSHDFVGKCFTGEHTPF
jgi:hypothetical protein